MENREHMPANELEVQSLEQTTELESSFDSVREFTQEIEEKLRNLKWSEGDIGDIQTGLDEALKNAVIHGNLGIHENGDDTIWAEAASRITDKEKLDKKVKIQYHITDSEFKIIITDEGEGFEAEKLPDPTDNENLEKNSGRGILIMKHMFDSVEHNNKGNEVTLIKNKPQT